MEPYCLKNRQQPRLQQQDQLILTLFTLLSLNILYKQQLKSFLFPKYILPYFAMNIFNKNVKNSE